MATTTAVTSRIDATLREVAAEIAFLPELVEGWQEEAESSRASWQLEWHELLARFRALERDYNARAMSEQQRQQYEDLVLKLQERKGLLRQIGVE
jgi:hypothetical protein